MVFDTQKGNRQFVRETVKVIVQEFVEYVNELHTKEEVKIEFEENEEQSEEEDKDESPVSEKTNKKSRIATKQFEDIISSDKYLDKIQKSVHTLLDKLEDKYKEDIKNTKNNYLSIEIRWLISFIRKQLVLEVFKRRIGNNENDIESLTKNEIEQFKNADDITKVLLEFIFDIVINEILKLKTKNDYEKIFSKREMDDHFDETLPYKDYLTDYLNFFQSCLFRENFMIKAKDSILNYITERCKSKRYHILKKFGINLTDFDLDLNILKDTLEHSMSISPVVLTISVADIIQIHNILISKYLSIQFP